MRSAGPETIVQAGLPRTTRRHLLAMSALGLAAGPAGLARAAGASGKLTIAAHVSLAPTWFDPAETSGIITPYLLMYAMHDALVKDMPGGRLVPSLAETSTVSADGLAYDFTLRANATFHDGSPVTSDDVKFSFERYRGTAQQTLKERVATIETPDPRHVRFRMKEPWPDFLTFYGGATGAGWIVPRKYVERVGDDGYKKAPIGAGPYRFVSFNPGVELVLEAFETYWRRSPSIKHLVFKVIPDESTRLAALKRGEVDIAYSIRGELADEIQRTPGLSIAAPTGSAPFWLYFPEQWDAKSPWHDQRVRLAASLAIDRKSMNEALTLGRSRLTGSIIPENFEFYWQPPAPVYDPARARKLLAEAGFRGGFDAGDYYCDTSYANIAEIVVNNLQEIGIRSKLRALERAAFFKGYAEKKYKNIIQAASGAMGNTATRVEAFLAAGGTYVYGTYPEIDALFRQQATETDTGKREALLHKIQQIEHERTIYAPIWQLAFICGVGPRVAESGFSLINGFPYTAPYEDMRLKTPA